MRRRFVAIVLAGFCLPAVFVSAVSAHPPARAHARAPSRSRARANGGAFAHDTTPAATATNSTGPFARIAATTATTTSESPVPVAPSSIPPVGRRLSSDEVLEIAGRLPKMRRERARYRGSYDGAYLKGPARWQVSYFAHGGKEIGQVIIADASGRVLEQWTGFQVAWSMARGYPGAFGRHVNALYIWLPLCALFLLPFVDRRRLFSLNHLDLLALLSLSVSLAFFNHGDVGMSVPLTYPPLVYLLVRMLAAARGRGGFALRSWIPAQWLAVGVVFLLGFRIGLNVTDSNVIDVGFAGVIGAQRVVDGGTLYGHYPSDNEHGDTYGPANYEAYVPFEQVFGWSGTWDDLPAAHAAAICFDILAIGLLFLLGRRVRGPALGVTLAYAWVAYPFTLFALESNSNDTLVAVLVLAALLFATSPPARGVFAALAGLTKFAPLALAPLLATHGLRELPAGRRARALGLFVLAFVLSAALVSIPALAHDSLHEIYERTLAYQANRGAPFSVWGLYGPSHALQVGQTVVQAAAVALALGLALVRRPPGVPALAAACAAILIAVQLGLEYWFYLYIVWFFPLAMLALLGLPERAGRASTPQAPAPPDAASAPARSSPLAVA
jgi:hypothetical protein